MRRSLALLFGVAGLVFALDLLTKRWAKATFKAEGNKNGSTPISIKRGITPMASLV